MNKIATVIGFTFRQKARTKSFIITTLILALIITIAMNLPYIISLFNGGKSGDSSALDHERLALIAGEHTEIADQLEKFTTSQSIPAVSWVRAKSPEDPIIQQGMKDDSIEGYVQITKSTQGVAFPNVEYVSFDSNPSEAVITLLKTGFQEAKVKAIIGGQSLTSEQIQEISTPVSIDSRKISTAPGDGDSPGQDVSKASSQVNYVVVYALMILFFTSTMMTGNMIASEVTSEKSSRIMEILITSVSPLIQMFGKIIGIFMVGLLQIAVFAVTIGANALLPHNRAIFSEAGVNMSDLNVSVLVYGLILYIMGYFLYAVLFAAVGSIVSRTEDLGQAVMPITMLALAAFYIGIFNIAAPDTLFIKVAGYIPFTSPTVMLLRIGLERAAIWEIWLSLAILVLSILFFAWLAAKIYRTGVLMYGKRPTIKELRKAMKAYKI